MLFIVLKMKVRHYQLNTKSGCVDLYRMNRVRKMNHICSVLLYRATFCYMGSCKCRCGPSDPWNTCFIVLFCIF